MGGGGRVLPLPGILGFGAFPGHRGTIESGIITQLILKTFFGLTGCVINYAVRNQSIWKFFWCDQLRAQTPRA